MTTDDDGVVVPPEEGRAAPADGVAPAGERVTDGAPPPDATTDLYDLRVVVDRIEGRSVCGLEVGDCFEVTRSSQVTIPDGGHFCLYAMAAVLPLLPAKQRALDDGDWMAQDSYVACPDPDERVIMRIERGARTSVPTEELT